MANTLTSLAADIYKAADTVGRELVGAIPAVTLNSDKTKAAAKGDTVRAAFTRSVSVTTSYAPAMTIPEGTDQTVDNKTMTVDNYANVMIPYTGEDMKHLNNGSGFETVYGDQIQQAMRAITNKIELDLLLAVKNGAGGAYGTSGTTPFATTFNDVAELRKVLVDRGCPDDGQITGVWNTAAGTKLRQLSSLYKVNESGNDDMLRRGVLLDLYGVKLRESAQVASHTAGTGASYQLNGAHAVGATTITVDTGTGTILAGDVVTINSVKYVVATALSGGSFTINSGLRAAGADNDTVTVAASYTGNVAFHRNAVELCVRPVAMPFGGDAATDMMAVQDPKSGLIYTIAMYKGYQKAMIDVGVLYGYKVWKPDFVAINQG